MTTRILNLFKLFKVLKLRGNWQLIRSSKKQLLEFILCKNGLNKKPLLLVIPYWFHMLKGIDVLIWRLETFGFLHSSSLGEPQKNDQQEQEASSN